MTSQLDTLLRETTGEPRVVDVTPDRTTVTALTLAAYPTAVDATVAAHELLAQAVRLGYRFHGGQVGAQRCSSGWHGELVEAILVERAAARSLPSAA